MSVEEATLRTVMAIKNKYVTMLGNPKGRLLFEREGYPIKMKQVIDAASDYSKAIEINSHPMRLDLEWRFLKYGKEKGVKIIINPDARNTHALIDVNTELELSERFGLKKRM